MDRCLLLLLISAVIFFLPGCKDKPDSEPTVSQPKRLENTALGAAWAQDTDNSANASEENNSENPNQWSGPRREREVQVYRGTSDASAAVIIDGDLFVMADDENNILRVYRIGEPSAIYSYDLTGFLKTDADHPEADIEGATKIGKRVYWITSHGRNKDGKLRPNRYRFFATDIVVDGEKIKIDPVGTPCRTLLNALVSDRRLRSLDVHKAAGLGLTGLSKKELKKLAPKEEGLNIEGLCASADGATLYVGFRNPRPVNKSTGRNRALVVPLKNAPDIIEKGDKPVFGDPMLWDLGGLGVRAMEYSIYHKAYFIVAGAFDTTRDFALYRWSGLESEQPGLLRLMRQSSFGPEALAPFDRSELLLFLSDDGTLPVSVSDPGQCIEGELNPDGSCPNKFLLNPNKKTFQAICLTPQSSGNN